MRHVSVNCCGATERGHTKRIYVMKEMAVEEAVAL